MINICIILLLINILCYFTFITSINIDKHYLRYNDYDYQYLKYNDYEDELIKLENTIAIDIQNNIILNYNKEYTYEFNIICYPNYNKCDEYLNLKYNMHLNQLEDNVIHFLYYILKNVNISRINNNDNCCNNYIVMW